MKSHPDWTHGGNVTLGLIHLRRQGQVQKAKPLFEAMARNRDDFSKVFKGNPDRAANFDLLMSGVGHELAVAGEFAAATEFYELTSPELALEECRWFGKEPAMQQLAVRIVNRMLAGLDDPAELTRQAGSPLFVEAAKITAEINQPYVAARLAQAMITRWQLPSAQQQRRRDMARATRTPLRQLASGDQAGDAAGHPRIGDRTPGASPSRTARISRGHRPAATRRWRFADQFAARQSVRVVDQRGREGQRPVGQVDR